MTDGRRVALVTGVGRPEGIALTVARALLDDGLHVVASDRADRGLLDHERAAFVAADLADPEGPRALVDAAVAAFGQVDAIVAAHADEGPGGLLEIGAADLDRAFAINARASVLLVQALVRARREDQTHGRAVLFTSGQHRGPMPGELPYVVSKGAIHQMTRTLAEEVAGTGLTVNAVNPGPVDTGWADAALAKELTERFPAGRWGLPADIAPAVRFLVSPESAWITGRVLDVDGGFRGTS
jgi:3-oxoacyl-[acyl-carrier protein] reductase